MSSEVPRRRRRRRRTVLLVSLAVVLAAAAAFVWNSRRGPERGIAIVAEVVERGRFVREVTGSGVIEAERERALAFARGGTIAEVLVAEGDNVEAGAILASLDVAEIERSIASTRASLASAEADLARTVAQVEADAIDTESALLQAEDQRASARTNLRDGEAEVVRNERLFALGAVSLDTLRAARDAVAAAERALAQAELRVASAERRRDNQAGLAEAGRASAEANVARLRADLENLEARLEESVVRAPFAGVVATLTAEVGNVVGTQPVATVADPGALRIRASFDENRASELRVGMPASVVPDADTRLRLPARVERIAPVAAREGGSAQVEVVLAFAGEDAAEGVEGVDDGAARDLAQVRPGYTATVRVRVAEAEDVFLVPLEALQDVGVGDVRALFRVVPDVVEEGLATTGIVERLEVVPLERNATVAAIEPSGGALVVGDAIAVVGIDVLDDGARVAFPPIETP